MFVDCVSYCGHFNLITSTPRGRAGFLHMLARVKILHYLKWMRKRDGGVVNCVMQLGPLQAQHGHEVVLLTADASDVPRESWRHGGGFAAGLPACVEVELRDRVAELRGSSVRRAEGDTPFQLLTPSAMREARKLIEACDVVHVHGPWSSSNLQIAALARRCGKPYVVSAHGMLDDWSMAQSARKKRLFLGLFGRRMLDGARAIHCTARGEAEQVSKHTSAPTRVVALPMELGPFLRLPGPEMARERFSLRRGVANLLFLSRLHPKKGAEHAIDALIALRGRGVDCDLVLAGPAQDAAYAQMLEARIAAAGVGEHARFVGMVDGQLKLSLYQACDVLVLPTSQENFGFVLVESLACGTPVVTTKGVDLWAELEASGGGVIANAEGNAVAKAVVRVLHTDQGTNMREAMGAKGRAWALAMMEPAGLIGAYESMYRGT